MEVNTVVVDETERRKVDARVVMTATDSQMGYDPVGAMMAKYDKDKNGTFDVHEVRAIVSVFKMFITFGLEALMTPLKCIGMQRLSCFVHARIDFVAHGTEPLLGR